jgi:hypothetical protein
MKAEDYLKGLDVNNQVWDSHDEYEYTEEQMMNFAEAYHKAKLEEMMPSDEEIEKELNTHKESELKYDYDMEKRQEGAKWLKKKLLNNKL